MDQAERETQIPLNLEEVHACPLCASERLRAKYRVRHISGDSLHLWALEGGFPASTVVECQKCGFLCKKERPSGAYLGEHYTRSGEEYLDRVAEDHPTIREDFRTAREMLRRAFPQQGSVLDVGCASGFFLESLGRGWEKHGLEIFQLAAQRARGRDGIVVHECDIDRAGFADDSFDVVTAFDVVEHLAEPTQFFREARRILKPEGRLILGTGSTSSFGARMSQNRWSYFSIPEHVSFFSPRSLETGLRSAGFLRTKFKRIHHGERSVSAASGWLRAVGKHWAIAFCGEGIVRLKLFRQKTSEFPVPYFFDHMLCIAWGQGAR